MKCYYDGSFFGVFETEQQFERYLTDGGWKIDGSLVEYEDYD